MSWIFVGFGEGMSAALAIVASGLKSISTKEGQDMDANISSETDGRTVNNTVRHAYRVLSDNEKIDMMAIKDAGANFLDHIDTVASHGNDSRELALARTKVEEAVMWAVKHITR